MSSYQAKNLLVKAASYYRRQKEAVSKLEIRKKINEIKYLSAQKKVPKISLRKEIIHLENTLESVFELENALLVQQRRESAKVNVLKAEIAALKRLLAVSGDKDLRKKVDHLAQVLGDFKAGEEIRKDVALSQKVAAEKYLTGKHLKHLKEPLIVNEPVDEQTTKRVCLLHKRLNALKQELEVSKEIRTDSEDSKIKEIERKILLLEANLNQFYREKVPKKSPGKKKPEAVEMPLETSPLRQPKVRHTFILGGPGEKKEIVLSKEEKVELEKELPLPPPPRMVE